MELGLGGSPTGVTLSIHTTPSAVLNPPWKKCDPVIGFSTFTTLMTKNVIPTVNRSYFDKLTNTMTFRAIYHGIIGL